MKVKATILALFGFFLVPESGNALGLIHKAKCSSLECRAEVQQKNLNHAKYICHHGARYPKWWSCKAVVWIGKQLRKTQARLRPAIESFWYALASCESGQNWSYNGGSGFDGGLQFHPGTWSSYRLRGYPAFAYQASAAQQVIVARRVLASQGWGAWPACSAKLGLR